MSFWPTMASSKWPILDWPVNSTTTTTTRNKEGYVLSSSHPIDIDGLNHEMISSFQKIGIDLTSALFIEDILMSDKFVERVIGKKNVRVLSVCLSLSLSSHYLLIPF